MLLVDVHERVGALQHVRHRFVDLRVVLGDAGRERDLVGFHGVVGFLLRAQLVHERVAVVVVASLRDDDEFVAANSVHGAVLESLAEYPAVFLDEGIPLLVPEEVVDQLQVVQVAFDDGELDQFSLVDFVEEVFGLLVERGTVAHARKRIPVRDNGGLLEVVLELFRLFLDEFHVGYVVHTQDAAGQPVVLVVHDLHFVEFRRVVYPDADADGIGNVLGQRVHRLLAGAFLDDFREVFRHDDGFQELVELLQVRLVLVDFLVQDFLEFGAHRLETRFVTLYVDVANHVEVGRERRHDGVVLLVGGNLGHVEDDVREDDAAAEHVADDVERAQRGQHLENAAADGGEHAQEHGQELAAVLRCAAFHLEQAKERNDDVGRVLAAEQESHRAGLLVEHGVVDGEEEAIRDVQEQEPELDGDQDHRHDTQDRGVLDALAQVVEGVA